MGGERRVPLAGRDKLFVLSRTRDTEIHRESGTMSRRPLANLYPAASFGVSVPLSFYFQPKTNTRWTRFVARVYFARKL